MPSGPIVGCHEAPSLKYLEQQSVYGNFGVRVVLTCRWKRIRTFCGLCSVSGVLGLGLGVFLVFGLFLEFEFFKGFLVGFVLWVTLAL